MFMYFSGFYQVSAPPHPPVTSAAAPALLPAPPPPFLPPPPCVPNPAGTSDDYYLLSAYRVGMLALDTLGKRIREDRPQAQYAKTPGYGEDVKWLHAIAQKLGKSLINRFKSSIF